MKTIRRERRHFTQTCTHHTGRFSPPGCSDWEEAKPGSPLELTACSSSPRPACPLKEGLFLPGPPSCLFNLPTSTCPSRSHSKPQSDRTLERSLDKAHHVGHVSGVGAGTTTLCDFSIKCLPATSQQGNKPPLLSKPLCVSHSPHWTVSF